jgi:alpha-methylacyl-CoA racemase
VSGGRQLIDLDLKDPLQRDQLREYIAGADILVEGYRPGVMERLGLGPEDCLARNEALIYARITGWGQDGPLAQVAGHDIDYLAVTGALNAIGTREHPVPPVNLLGDYAAGALYAAFGIVAAVHERGRSGRGQVIDAAMIDGLAELLRPIRDLTSSGAWLDRREVNLLDGGAPFYGVYTASDGRHLAVGALEPVFFAELCRVLGVAGRPEVEAQYDRSTWPAMGAAFAHAISERTRDEWEHAFAGVDACVAPVLDMTEAKRHPHNVARDTFATPAPRLSRTPATLPPAESIAADDDFLTQLARRRRGTGA